MNNEKETTIQTGEGTPPLLNPEKTLMDLFEELSFAEKWQRVFEGLKMPKDSGEYKWARLQVIRLSAPIAAVVVPVLMAFILAVFAVLSPPPSRTPQITIKEPVETEIPKEIEEIKPPEIEPQEVVEYEIPDANLPVSDIPSPPTDFSPKPAKYDAVALVKSPVIFKGIYGSRTPGARGAAMRKFGGSGTEAAVLRALRWLKKYQDESGCWYGHSGGGGGSYDKAAAAFTGIALLAYLAHGETPASVEFGYTVEKAIRWLAENQGPDGSWTQYRDGHDYASLIATYAITEAYGMTQVPTLEEHAKRGLKRILKGQHASGGWNYNCNMENRDDTSVMGWAVQALKAGLLADITELTDDINKALKNAIPCFRAHYKEISYDAGGTFGYTGQGGHNMTPIGCLGLQYCGAGNDPTCEGGLKWLDNIDFVWGKPNWTSRPLYHYYYATQALFNSGGSRWNRWNAKFSKKLVEQQQIIPKAIEGPDGELKDIGYWDAPGTTDASHSRVFNTAICTLMLEVYYRYLPTFKVADELPRADIAEEEKKSDVKINIQF